MSVCLNFTTNQNSWGLMMVGDQGGSSLGLYENSLRSGLVLEQGQGAGTYTSAWPETEGQLQV